MEDTYKTIARTSEGIYKDKGSKFLAFAFPVRSVEEIKKIVETKRKEFHDARHVCYAYMLGAERTDFRANDDGEPSGTAGKPILGQINSNQLSDILIIVVRYFGGILLGTSGLIQAYKAAASEAIVANEIVERIVEATHTIRFDYAQMNVVMNLIKKYDLTILSQQLELECRLTFLVRKSFENNVIEAFSKTVGITFDNE